MNSNSITKVTMLGGEVIGAVGASRTARDAWRSRDRLEIINAVVSILAVITGVLLTIRQLKSLRDEEK